MLNQRIPQIFTLSRLMSLDWHLQDIKKVHNSLELWTLSLSDSQLSLSLSGAYGTLTYTIKKSHKAAIC